MGNNDSEKGIHHMQQALKGIYLEGIKRHCERNTATSVLLQGRVAFTVATTTLAMSIQ